MGSYLTVTGNDALSSLAGLGQLTSVGTHLIIGGNDALISLVGWISSPLWVAS